MLPCVRGIAIRGLKLYRKARISISRAKQSTSYQIIAGTPGKKFWIGNIALSGAFLGIFALSNSHLLIDSIALRDYLHAFVYTMWFVSYSYFFNMAVSLPFVTNISKFFAKKEIPAHRPQEDTLPKVTIQIPCRNEPFEIVRENALRSALETNYPSDRLAIQVLDNSDPGKFEELEEYCRNENLVFIHRDGTEGAKARNLNIGLKRSKGEYILVLDADNRIDPDYLQNVVAEMLSDNSLAYVFTIIDYWNFDENAFTKTMSSMNLIYRKTQWAWDQYGWSPLNGFGVLLDQSKLEEVGGWDEAKIGEDWALAIQLYKAGHKGKRISYAVLHDAEPNNLEKSKKRQRRWALGSYQNIADHVIAGDSLITNKDISWNEKVDMLLRLSWYPGLVTCILFPALTSATLGLFLENEDIKGVNELFTWWKIAGLSATAMPFLSYITDRLTGKKESQNTRFWLIVPGIMASMGSLAELGKGFASYVSGIKEGFWVTPKGGLEQTTILETLSKHKIELILGSYIMISFITNPYFTGVYGLAGLGLLISPFLSWYANRKAE